MKWEEDIEPANLDWSCWSLFSLIISDSDSDGEVFVSSAVAVWSVNDWVEEVPSWWSWGCGLKYNI